MTGAVPEGYRICLEAAERLRLIRLLAAPPLWATDAASRAGRGVASSGAAIGERRRS